MLSYIGSKTNILLENSASLPPLSSLSLWASQFALVDSPRCFSTSPGIVTFDRCNVFTVHSEDEHDEIGQSRS